MSIVTLPHGTVEYRAAGPPTGTAVTGPPVVFVHGILVDGALWHGVAEALADGGVRSYAPDLPLGSHRRAVAADADQSPRGVARQVLAFMAALDLTDVTLVGNDTGGAICQYLLDTDASRVGRVVLTNCDAFEDFPPPALRRFVQLAEHPAALLRAAQAMRSTRVRHGKVGYGSFARAYDATTTRAWIEPAATDADVRRDIARFAKAVDPADLVAVGARLRHFEGPVRLVWGTDDPYFTLDLARRLAAAFSDAELVEVPAARTFVPLDAPDRVATEILSFSQAGSRRAAP